MGRGLAFRGQSRLHPKVAEPELSPISGVPFYLCVQNLSQNYQIWRCITGNKCGRKTCILGSAMPLIPREQNCNAPPIFGVLRYFCLHPLTQNNQIRYVTLRAGFGVVRIDPLRFLTSVYTFLPFLSHSFNSNWTVTVSSSIVYTYSILLIDCICFYYTLLLLNIQPFSYFCCKYVNKRSVQFGSVRMS